MITSTISKEIDDWADTMDEKDKTQCRQRWQGVCKKLVWPIKWERDQPPRDLKMLQMIASLSNDRKLLSPSPSKSVRQSKRRESLRDYRLARIKRSWTSLLRFQPSLHAVDSTIRTHSTTSRILEGSGSYHTCNYELSSN